MLYVVSHNNRQGYIDKNGSLILQYKYRHASPFFEGLATVCFNDKYGYINEHGDVVIEFIFDEADCFHNGVAVVWNNGLCGLIDKSGNYVVPPKFESISGAHRGFVSTLGVSREELSVACETRSGYGICDGQGIFIIEPNYENASGFDELGWALLTNKEGGTFFDHKGNVKLQVACQDINCFYEDYATFKIDGKYGLIYREGVVIILPKYDNAQACGNGLIPVLINNKWGFIDTTDAIAINAVYDNVTPFEGGMAVVQIGGFWGVIDISGRIIIDPKWDDLNLYIEEDKDRIV